MVDLDAGAQRLAVRGRTDGGDHELLDVDVGVGVRPTVEDVHHRDRQHVRVRAAEVAEERQVGRVGGGLGHGERDAEDRVGAELALVGGAVEVDQRGVDQALLGGLEADELGGDLVDDGVDGLLDALAQVAGGVAVTALDGLERAGRGARGDGGAGDGAVVEGDLDLDSGVAARVQDLAGADGLDAGHGCSFEAGGFTTSP